MKAMKIFFSDDDYEFMTQYKKATKVSYADFVQEAVKEKRSKLELENYLRDLKYSK